MRFLLQSALRSTSSKGMGYAVSREVVVSALTSRASFTGNTAVSVRLDSCVRFDAVLRQLVVESHRVTNERKSQWRLWDAR